VERLVGRLSLPVDVQALPAERLPPPVEASVYFFVSEALTNVEKHAGAEAATVRIDASGGRLVVEVADDGAGGADVEGGSGLSGLMERVAALDGELAITSPPGAGTVLHAEIPLG
jgi:signal transduction histidine kinase